MWPGCWCCDGRGFPSDDGAESPEVVSGFDPVTDRDADPVDLPPRSLVIVASWLVPCQRSWRCLVSGNRVRGQRLTRSERLEVRGRIGEGESFEDAAGAVRCSTKTVQRVLNSVGGVHVRDRDRAKLQLSLCEREEISLGICAGESFCEIARRLSRSSSTISREVNINGGRGRYRAVAADEAAYRRARRPKPAKLSTCPRLRREVESMLDKNWSPQQISARLVIEFPDDPEMRVSHETIYQSLFVQSRGALRKELTASLRTGRTRRRPHGRKDPGGYIKDMVVISDRRELRDTVVEDS